MKNIKLKKQTIRMRMQAIISLQVLISVLFLLYSTITTAYQSYNDLSNRYFQTGEQVLSTAENAVEHLEETALFPISLAISNNDFTITRAMRNQCIFQNYHLYSYFGQQARSRINSGSVEMLALYDMDGHGVAVQNGSYSEYRVCFVPDDAEWYHTMLNVHAGKPYILPASESVGTGMPDVDGSYLCVCRGLMDISSFQITGYCMAGIRKSTIEYTFDSLRLSQRQSFCIYYQDRLLLSSDIDRFAPVREEWSAAPDDNVHQKEIRLIDKVTCIVNTVRHENGYSIVLHTPLSDAVGTISGVQVTFTLIIGLILIAMALDIVSSVRYIMNAMRQLIDACDNFELKTNSQIADSNLPDEISYLFRSFNHMSDRIHGLVDEVVAKQAKLQETELQLLRTQINPHYLYNTLEMIHMRAYMKKNYDIANMAELLGQNLQYGLRNTTKKVRVKTELEQVNIYLEILSFQYGNRIRTSVFIENDLLDCRIPKLIFQPIIENSVVHGIISSEQILNIDIMGYRSENSIIFKISDDGCGMDEAQLSALKDSIKDTTSASIGLRNVCRRILLNYGEEYQAEIESKKNVGSTVTLYLPYLPDTKPQITDPTLESTEAEEAKNGNKEYDGIDLDSPDR